MVVSKENKFPPSFSGLILKNFSMNPVMMNILSSNRKQEHPQTSIIIVIIIIIMIIIIVMMRMITKLVSTKN